jgi:hypothetical protein
MSTRKYLAAIFVLAYSPWLVAASTSAPIDLRLLCPIQGAFLDGTAILGEAAEEIAIKARPIEMRGEEAGKSQRGWFTDAKIRSNKRVYEVTLLANGPEYALVAYGTRLKEGLGGVLMSTVYHINLPTLKFKRTTAYFPARKDVSAEGVCKKL